MAGMAPGAAGCWARAHGASATLKIAARQNEVPRRAIDVLGPITESSPHCASTRESFQPCKPLEPAAPAPEEQAGAAALRVFAEPPRVVQGLVQVSFRSSIRPCALRRFAWVERQADCAAQARSV